MRRGLLLAVAVVALAAPAGAQAGIPVGISGHVGDRSGVFPGTQGNLAGVTVELYDNSTNLLADSDTTDASGNYTLTLPVGSHRIVASKTGYATQCRTVEGTGGSVTAPLIEMPMTSPTNQAGSLSGTVTDNFTSNPIQGATVEISYDQGCGPLVSTQTGSNGGYVFASQSLPGPVHVVTYSAPGYHSHSTSVNVYMTGELLSPGLDQLDTIDPRTKIKSVTVDGHKVKVKFKGSDPEPSDGGLNFTCEIDNLGGDECESPQTYGHIPKGKHKIKVTAFDGAGNSDETPAKESFRIG